MMEGLGPKFIGTSNCLIAMRRDIEAIGTNAHELPMVYSALADTDDELRQAPYKVLADWQEEHDGNLRIILPDTYGTEGFLRARAGLAGDLDRHPHRFAATRPRGAEIAIRWWQSRGEDPREKLVIFSDGLDVDKIIELHAQFDGRVRASFGWGTLLTNDFRGLVPGDALAPFSLVCKAVSANGRPTVKLSRQSAARRWGRRPRSSATSGCSASASRRRWRWWSEARAVAAGAAKSLRFWQGSSKILARPDRHRRVSAESRPSR